MLPDAPHSGVDRLTRAPCSATIIVLSTLHWQRLTPLPPPSPHPWIDGVLGSMLAVALLAHFVAIMAYVVLGIAPSRENFFTDQGKLQVHGVELVSASGLGPRPEGAQSAGAASPRTQPPTAKSQRRAVAAKPVAAPAAAAKVPSRAPAAAPHAVPARIASAPSALAHNTSARQTTTGPSVAGVGTGRANGLGGGQGSGVGTGGTGTGLQGTGTGGGGQPGGNAVQRRLSATAQYQSTGFLDMQKQDVRLPEDREPTSWEDLCTFLGLPISTLHSRPHVSPFMTRFPFVAYSRADMEAMVGRFGQVTVRITVSKEGTPTASIARSSGDRLIDRTAFAIASSTHWLPALEHGRPVEETVEFPITFDEGTKSGIYLRAAPQDNGGASAPVTVPGGAGQYPNSIPGGAGKPPGSF